ncbi:putative flagellum biosynthesis repressor protein FlbT 1 [Desulfosarcina widdelii]|uniref:Putative flagellum biosynthesis repressor protein FlbT 1 n=1 Tax=Desulfosarcina widdelii TaxID=947919 RepID=A0A5K7YZB0_9BACT|nr:flagellar biosynthesis repressor FlbT [Desulfosarcina widdelii]BBO73730.1 putative flagellum biosynthesis repressor protein FlbT 1 [Desulfosarcina widdelii]
MGLKITLKPGERMIIGGAVITNGGQKCNFIVENKVSILRDKDILSAEKANSPARRIYFAIQLMYIDASNLKTHHKSYWELVKDFLEAAPSALGIVDQISEYILEGNYYQALKNCKKLIAFEEEIIARVQ